MCESATTGKSVFTRSWSSRFLIACVLGAVLILSIGAVPAFAWSIDPSAPSSYVQLHRDSDDSTGAVTWVVYSRAAPPNLAVDSGWEYGSGKTWASFDATVSLPAGADSVYLRSPQQYCFAVNITDGAKVVWMSPVWYKQAVQVYDNGGTLISSSNPLPTREYGGSLNATITTMPAVSVGSSLSVAGTLPVDVASIGPVDSDGLKVSAIVGLVVLGLITAGAVRARK